MNQGQNLTIESKEKSKFVTIVAWIFIVISGFTTFISILQNIMINFFFPLGKMKESINTQEAAQSMPRIARFLFSNIKVFFFGFLVVSTITLISSLGLLKRKNWARLIFITILTLGMIWNLSSLFLQGAMMPKMPVGATQQEGMPNMQMMFTIMRVFTAIMAIGMSILFGWIIKKLASKDIKQEFV